MAQANLELIKDDPQNYGTSTSQLKSANAIRQDASNRHMENSTRQLEASNRQLEAPVSSNRRVETSSRQVETSSRQMETPPRQPGSSSRQVESSRHVGGASSRDVASSRHVVVETSRQYKENIIDGPGFEAESRRASRMETSECPPSNDQVWTLKNVNNQTPEPKVFSKKSVTSKKSLSQPLEAEPSIFREIQPSDNDNSKSSISNS